jgi:hypothetical protein
MDAGPDCRLAPDGPASIASGGSVDYLCTDQVRLTGTNVVPANIDLAWSIRATIDGAWSVRLLPPVTEGQEPVSWTAAGQPAAEFTFDSQNPAGVALFPGSVDTTVGIEYRVRIHRATCALDPQTLLLHRDVTVQSPNITAESTGDASEPFRVTPDLLAIPEPAIAFGGPLNFGSVGVTALGVDDATQSGTLTLTVTGLEAACGSWNLRVSATELTDQSGAALADSRLIVVLIDNQSLPGGDCDLGTGCNLASLPAGPDAPSTRTITLGVVLHMPQQPGPGSFATSIDAQLIPAANS